MKNKIVFLSSVFTVLVFVFAVLSFSAKPLESKTLDVQGVLTINHQTTTSGNAHATNTNGGYYTGTVSGAKTYFSGMPSGTYTITICAANGSTNYNKVISGYSYNGGDVGFSTTLNTGMCTPD